MMFFDICLLFGMHIYEKSQNWIDRETKIKDLWLWFFCLTFKSCLRLREPAICIPAPMCLDWIYNSCYENTENNISIVVASLSNSSRNNGSAGCSKGCLNKTKTIRKIVLPKKFGQFLILFTFFWNQCLPSFTFLGKLVIILKWPVNP